MAAPTEIPPVSLALDVSYVGVAPGGSGVRVAVGLEARIALILSRIKASTVGCTSGVAVGRSRVGVGAGIWVAGGADEGLNPGTKSQPVSEISNPTPNIIDKTRYRRDSDIFITRQIRVKLGHQAGQYHSRISETSHHRGRKMNDS